MGCCKSRGGLFRQEEDLSSVPEKYRDAIKTKNDKELINMFNAELNDIVKPNGVDMLDKLKAELDEVKNGLLTEVRATRMNQQS